MSQTAFIEEQRYVNVFLTVYSTHDAESQSKEKQVSLQLCKYITKYKSMKHKYDNKCIAKWQPRWFIKELIRRD